MSHNDCNESATKRPYLSDTSLSETMNSFSSSILTPSSSSSSTTSYLETGSLSDHPFHHSSDLLPFQYHNVLASAPMVRISTLAFRTACKTYGANMLYSEELVAKKLAQCQRITNIYSLLHSNQQLKDKNQINDQQEHDEQQNHHNAPFIHYIEPRIIETMTNLLNKSNNNAFGEYISAEQYEIAKMSKEYQFFNLFNINSTLTTYPSERLVVQLGAGNAIDALNAANIVTNDCKAIDLNVGCPKAFSTQGLFGSELLTRPEILEDIVKTLKRNINNNITVKIRMLSDINHTVELIRRIESLGIDAIAIHCRFKPDRPRFQALPLLQLPLLSSITKCPLLYNGDIYSYHEIEQYKHISRGCWCPDENNCICSFGHINKFGVQGVLIGRGAISNPSVFGHYLSNNSSQPIPLFNINQSNDTIDNDTSDNNHIDNDNIKFSNVWCPVINLLNKCPIFNSFINPQNQSQEDHQKEDHRKEDYEKENHEKENHQKKAQHQENDAATKLYTEYSRHFTDIIATNQLNPIGYLGMTKDVATTNDKETTIRDDYQKQPTKPKDPEQQTMVSYLPMNNRKKNVNSNSSNDNNDNNNNNNNNNNDNNNNDNNSNDNSNDNNNDNNTMYNLFHQSSWPFVLNGATNQYELFQPIDQTAFIPLIREIDAFIQDRNEKWTDLEKSEKKLKKDLQSDNISTKLPIQANDTIPSPCCDSIGADNQSTIDFNSNNGSNNDHIVQISDYSTAIHRKPFFQHQNPALNPTHQWCFGQSYLQSFLLSPDPHHPSTQRQMVPLFFPTAIIALLSYLINISLPNTKFILGSILKSHSSITKTPGHKIVNTAKSHLQLLNGLNQIKVPLFSSVPFHSQPIHRHELRPKHQDKA